MAEIGQLTKKTVTALKAEGIKGVQKRAKHYLAQRKEASIKGSVFKDVLFINGCPRDLLGQSVRYRVDHQKEQLESFGLRCDEIYYKNIQLDQVRLYRNFIIFRSIYTPELETFIQKARSLNKKVYYDIDDLVFDTFFTDLIPSVRNMPKDQKDQYDKDVELRKKLLMLCDGAITSTKRMKKELEKYVSEVFINRNCASMEMVSISSKVKKETSDTARIGYFSGSLTHNDDLNMLIPALTEIMEKYPNIELHLTGELSYPEALRPYAKQIHIHPLVDWKELPHQIAQMDINLAPLCDTVFNEAKSEIKWMEAALVKTCTVASKVGSFAEKIEDHKTGLLCSGTEEWVQALSTLIEDKELRQELAANAYRTCMECYISIYNGNHVKDYIQSHQSPNIVFAMPKVEISGGIMVCFRHMCALLKHGYDVSVLSLYDQTPWTTFMENEFPVLELDPDKIQGSIDQAVATMWPTVKLLESICGIDQRLYLVQNFETDFYSFEDPKKKQANESYCPKTPFTFITISKWCQSWLKERFDKEARWAPNGIDSHQFQPHPRDLKKKIRILIEGDCQAEHKNVDESFRIVEKLDPNHFEVWYMSYNAKPKSWYRIDRFFHRIPYEEVPSVYSQCDILIKTSLLESFSYPPLEMMATGGYVIAIANGGNREYLKDKENCLIYEKGNIDEAIQCIETLRCDDPLCQTLYKNGLECAQKRDWDEIEPQILDLYRR
ncbi:glycosyltransferase [uncultured Faecalicoccus sp.]|uniref:glycosyltransferase n=1 Tax=uncultured Faecalicoccus sp. TaxID=1971760 RepID=UPI002602F49E|nr:glycosyltransferase [uncultured Faecalicoccus sp.]